MQAFLRNSLCRMLALGLMASGRVRKARRKALSGDVVTAIYFHKPNKSLFAECMAWLRNNGYTFISAKDLLEILRRGKTPPRGAVWVSFDDGCKELLDNVLPLVRQHGIPVTLFIPTGIVGGDGLFPWLHGGRTNAARRDEARDAVTLAELQDISRCPHVTIGSHTVSHAVTMQSTEDKLRFELGESKRTLRTWFGIDVKYFAFPVGRFDGHEKSILEECGYEMAATTENAFVSRKTDPYLVPRFSVGDEISFPEAICNMVGVWRPTIDPIIRFLRPSSRITDPPKRTPKVECARSISS